MKTFKIYYDFDDLKEKVIGAESLVKAMDVLRIPYCSVIRVRVDGKILSEDELDEQLSVFDPSDLDPQAIGEHDLIKKAIDESINDLFKKVQDYFGMPGDISIEQAMDLDDVKETLQKILVNQLKINQTI